MVQPAGMAEALALAAWCEIEHDCEPKTNNLLACFRFGTTQSILDALSLGAIGVSESGVGAARAAK